MCQHGGAAVDFCKAGIIPPLPTNGGGSSGGTMARIATTHLAGTCRDPWTLVNYSTCLHRLTGVFALPEQLQWRQARAEQSRARELLDPQFALLVCCANISLLI
jgi:hypothetical protein